MDNRTLPFRALAAPLILPAVDTASQTPFPWTEGVVSLAVCNAWPLWMWLTGSASGTVAAAEGRTILVPPGFWGVIFTSNPAYLSCLAVDRPNFPLKSAGSLIYPDAKLVVIPGSGE